MQSALNTTPGRSTEPTEYAAIRAHLAAEHPAIVFAALSGSRRYGTAGETSDYDVLGLHLLPFHRVVSAFAKGPETVANAGDRDGLWLDVTTHDAEKFLRLLVHGNGPLLEAIYAPPIITSASHEELRGLAMRTVTWKFGKCYLEMASNQQRRLRDNTVKLYLHVYRCLLTGLHLMKTGKLEVDLPTLCDLYDVPLVPGLLMQKQAGETTLSVGRQLAHQESTAALSEELQRATAARRTEGEGILDGVIPALDAWLIALRLEDVGTLGERGYAV